MCAVAVCVCAERHVIHVATTGSDGNSGTSSHPLLTFGAAQAKARGFPPTENVTIQFAAGSYAVNETQVLSAQDSGAAGSPRIYEAAPGATVALSGDARVTGWRKVASGDAAWPVLGDDARASVLVAPLPPTGEVPRALFDAAAEAAEPANRAVRALPNTNVVSSLVPTARQDSETCTYVGQFKSEGGCRVAALQLAGAWAYAWHDPAQIQDDFAAGCYARRDEHGGRSFPAQDGVMSAVFAMSTGWREVADWDISDSVTTQHRCEGAECEYFDAEADKSAMHVSLEQMHKQAANDPSALSLRIYLVDFAMNVLPVASIEGGGRAGGSTVRTSYPGTLLLGQKPGYCDQDYDEGKCSPAVWLLNAMCGFDMPGQFAVNTAEGTVYYWPALASGDVSAVSVAATSTLVSLRGGEGQQQPVEHVRFAGLAFTRANRAPLQRGDADAGGIQHNWASLGSHNALLTLSGARDIDISGCEFSNSGGGGVRADGFAQRVAVSNSTFRNLGYEAIGYYGLGLGTTQVTSDNRIESNDVSSTALTKFDSPALVLWNAAHTLVQDNYLHDTRARALYLGGSRYCTKPTGFATDGGIFMNQWDQLTDNNIPAAWLSTCANTSYAYTFQDDCKCAFFRGAHGSIIRRNVFARVTTRKDRPFFSDGVVYISGPGYVPDPTRDATVFEDNTYLASPGPGAPSFRMLYVDGYTGSMRISRNAVVDANAHQGFMLCNWYGSSTVEANALQLGDASWGSDFEISANCDGNPVLALRANLVLSDEASGSHQPEASFVDQYSTMFDTVCTASIRAAAQDSSAAFLDALSRVIVKLGGQGKQCGTAAE
jgi:hypothetical protein